MQKKSIETVLYSTIGVVVMAAILVAFNVLTSALHQRVDLTKEKAYTLSAGTRAILAKLDSPVKIRFYCTQSETPTAYSVMFKSYANKVEDLLAEFKQNSHGKILIEKYNPQPDSDAEDSARLDGIDAQSLPDGQPFYLGLAVSLLDTKIAIPFLSPDRERQLEYDLSRAISQAVTPEKVVIGVMSPLPVFGMPNNPMMQQMGQQPQEAWTLISELKNDYTVRRVDMETDKIDDDVKVLIVIHPKNISDQAQYAIDQFVLRGGKLIAFLDPLSLVDSQGQNPMMGAMGGGGSSLDKLLKTWGLQFDTTKVVADATLKMEFGEPGNAQQRPVWLQLTPENINTNDITTTELDSIWVFGAGAFTGNPVAGLKESVLFKSTRNSQLVDGMMANLAADNILKEFKPSGVEYPLAVRLSGKFKTAFPQGKPEEKKDEEKKPEEKSAEKKPDNSLKESKQDNTVILVGDSDMIYDGYTLDKQRTIVGTMIRQLNANLNFTQNAIEQFSGDENLIAVRSRAAVDRPFTRIKKMESEAEAQYEAKLKELEDTYNQAVARINELQQQKGQNQRYILSPEQQAEIDNLKAKRDQVGKERRRLSKELLRNVTAMQRHIEMYNIVAVPLAVGLVGIVLAIYKQKRTSAK